MTIPTRYAGVLAALFFVMSVLVFGSALDGYSQGVHPIALLGARGLPHAVWFDVFGFVLPGVLAVLVAMRLRSDLGARAPWPARIGAGLVLISALAFAAQGLLPLDIEDLESSASRLHAMAWSAWWIAFVPGGLLLAFGLRANAVSRRAARISGFGALGVLGFAALASGVVPAPIAQRLAFAIWFAWLAAAPFALGTRGMIDPARNL